MSYEPLHHHYDNNNDDGGATTPNPDQQLYRQFCSLRRRLATIRSRYVFLGARYDRLRRATRLDLTAGHVGERFVLRSLFAATVETRVAGADIVSSSRTLSSSLRWADEWCDVWLAELEHGNDLVRVLEFRRQKMRHRDDRMTVEALLDMLKDAVEVAERQRERAQDMVEMLEDEEMEESELTLGEGWRRPGRVQMEGHWDVLLMMLRRGMTLQDAIELIQVRLRRPRRW